MKMMFAVLFGVVQLLLFVGFSAGSPTYTFQEGFNGRIIPYINGGKEILDLIEVPHQVALYVYPTTEIETTCEGSLLSPRFILTAAICFSRILNSNFVVVAIFGANNITDSQTGRLALNVWIHPKWNNQTLENNLAIVEVFPVPLSDKIKPIRLPSKSQEKQAFTNQWATINGRGLFSNDEQLNNNRTLRTAKTQVVPNIYCRARYLFKTIVDSNICTSFSGAEGICKGDEGGPLVITDDDKNTTLIGVASFKDSPCQSSLPSVFTRVTSYLEWINGVTSIPLRP